MKKGRANQSQSVFNEESLHFRLCHQCWHLNESSSEVSQCEKCHRVFPTQYSQELFAIHEDGTTEGTLPRELWEEGDEDDLDESDDATQFTGETLGVTGLSVRW